MNSSELSLYLNKATDRIIADVLKSTLKNPKATAFLLKYKRENEENIKKRSEYEKKGKHIPPFLIASITDSCNLFCKGCYARAGGMCGSDKNNLLAAEKWEGIFKEAAEAGISFILLAGGEPLFRRDVIKKAYEYKSIIFPIFTNGTLFDREYIKILDNSRNLLPVLSIEGKEEKTDDRRGAGTYLKLINAMKKLKRKNILFGVSLTVTTENIAEITGGDFLNKLCKYGCRIVFYIEYVPVEKGTEHLALSQIEREALEEKIKEQKDKFETLLFLSFPGDEKYMGGCLAAGRGFFHISPEGKAEACPFSPYSDRSLTDYTLIEALDSPFFKRLKEEALNEGEHDGGCTLFAYEDKVKTLL